MTSEAAAEFARDFQESHGIETDALREHQAFGECHAVEAENEIDGELGPAAVTDLTDVESLRKQHVQYRFGIGRDLLVAADQSDAVAVPDLFAGARYRRLEKAQPAADAGAERRDAVGVAGAGAQHDLAGRGR